jgi:hypothetical protein
MARPVCDVVRLDRVRAPAWREKHGSFAIAFKEDRLPVCLGRQESCPLPDGLGAESLSNTLAEALTLPFDWDSLSIMALVRGLFWLVLFIVLAFCFVVLFEYGPRDFVNGSKKEFARVKSFVVKETEKVQKPKK